MIVKSRTKFVSWPTVCLDITNTKAFWVLRDLTNVLNLTWKKQWNLSFVLRCSSVILFGLTYV